MSSPREQHPGERELPGRAPFSSAISSTRATRSRFRWKFSPWKRGLLRRKSPSSRSSGDGELAGEEAAAERAVGDEADAELAHGRQHAVLRVARPQRVLGLQRRDRVDGVRAADRLRRRLGQAEVAHLAGRRRAPPSRRPSPRSARRGRRGAGSRGRCGRRRAAAATRRTPARTYSASPRTSREPSSLPRTLPNFVASTTSSRRPRSPCPTSSSFVNGPYMSAVSRKVDAELERAVDRRDRLGLVGVAVELRHPHAAEAQGGDLEPLRSELASVHEADATRVSQA